MQCMSCNETVDSRWQHAIAMNMCPNCGKEIVPSELKTLLATLKETMEGLKDYPDHVEDWLLSNHNFIKTTSPNIVSFIPESYLEEVAKINEIKSFEERKSKKSNDPEEISEFAKRANVSSIVKKNTKLKSMAQQIAEKVKNGGTFDVTDDEGEDYDSSETQEDYNVVSDPSVSTDYNQYEIPAEYSEDYDNNKSGISDYDEVPSIVKQMIRKHSKNNVNNDENILAKLKNKIDQAGNNFHSGGGAFRRA